MKFPIIKNWFILVALVLAGVVVLSSIHLFPTATADDAKKKSESSLNEKLIGTWVLVGKPGQVSEPPKAGGMLKFITGRDAKSGRRRVLGGLLKRRRFEVALYKKPTTLQYLSNLVPGA